MSDIRNLFFAEVARGAEDAAYRAGYDLVCATAISTRKSRCGTPNRCWKSAWTAS